MTNFYTFVAILLSIHLVVPYSVQSRNVSGQLNNEESSASNLSSNKTHLILFGNKSHYDYECDCGWASRGCSYDKKGKKECDCNRGYSQKGDKCEECNCGWAFHTCSFDVDGEKICNCGHGYSQKNDECERCDCGTMGTGCYFENSKKKCYCLGKYEQNYFDTCAECDCGCDALSCNFSGLAKVCTCRDGYTVEYGKCEKCDCGAMATSCELTIDKYTRCTCASGYVAVRSTWEMDEQCKLPGTSGWKIATYVESVFFAMITIACIISICYKRSITV